LLAVGRYLNFDSSGLRRYWELDLRALYIAWQAGAQIQNKAIIQKGRIIMALAFSSDNLIK